LETRQHPASRLAWVARAWNLDRELRIRIGSAPVTVVCLGAGLDTAYFRLDRPGNVSWYDIDLPDVAELRGRVLGAEPHVITIAGSVLERETYRLVKVAGRLIVVALGLLYYFDQTGVQTIFGHIGSVASGASAPPSRLWRPIRFFPRYCLCSPGKPHNWPPLRTTNGLCPSRSWNCHRVTR
jgi:O-methyltransferase involved in polyketide biosynthesis